MSGPEASSPRSGAARGSLLRAILQASEGVPRPIAALAAAAGLVAAIMAEVNAPGPLPAVPAYFLFPILVLAWFAGWRWTVAGAAAALAASAAADLLIEASGAGVLVHLARAATILVGVLLGRAAYVGRLMLDFYFRGAAWRALQKPIEVGDKLVIVPVVDSASAESKRLVRAGRIALLIQPGMAFGTASHPTTQMCLEFLERYLAPGDRVLDLGTGTGILAIAAAKLGARSVTAVDVDPEAVSVAAGNVELNGVSGRVDLWQGSLDLVHPGLTARGPAEASQDPSYQIVVANLLTGILREMIGAGLRKMLAPGGTMVVSGVRNGELEEFQLEVREHTLVIDQVELRGGWAALVLRAG